MKLRMDHAELKSLSNSSISSHYYLNQMCFQIVIGTHTALKFESCKGQQTKMHTYIYNNCKHLCIFPYHRTSIFLSFNCMLACKDGTLRLSGTKEAQ